MSKILGKQVVFCFLLFFSKGGGGGSDDVIFIKWHSLSTLRNTREEHKRSFKRLYRNVFQGIDYVMNV